MAYREVAAPSAVQLLPPAPLAALGVSPFTGYGLGSMPPLVSIPGIPFPVSRPTPDPATFTRFLIPSGERGTTATLQKMAAQVILNSQDPYFVMDARGVVRDLPSKAYYDEADAVMQWAKEMIDYRHDPSLMEWCMSPGWLLYMDGQGDCFTKGTVVLRRAGHALVPIESLRVGDEIWGQDRWSSVQATMEKGIRETWLVRLSNGGSMRLTPEHHVWRAVCDEHATQAKPCNCPTASRRRERVRVSELREKDVLLSPEKVAFGEKSSDPGRAYVEGLYLSEGWTDRPSAFFISGRDAHPREEQKREVASICERLGVPTRWAKRYLAIKDREWTAKIRAMGTHSWEKQALSLDHDETTSRELLRGILADSGRTQSGTGRSFSSASRALWLQTRVLLKAFGVSCAQDHLSSEQLQSYVPPGSAPRREIWRLGIRSTCEFVGKIYERLWSAAKKKPKTSSRPAPLLRVREIIRDGIAAPCFDITTDDHMVWLPEADWTTSQCNNGCALVAALDLAIGHGAMFRAVALNPDQRDEDGKLQYSHVYTMIGIREGPRVSWLAQDLVPTPAVLGMEPPREMWLLPPNDYIIVMP